MNRRLIPLLTAAVATCALLLAAATPSGHAVDLSAPDWLANITSNAQVTTLSDPDGGAAPELPGLGHKFELFGSMIQDTDPENAVGKSGNAGGGGGGNEVISDVVTPTQLAFAYRSLTPGIKITALTNQLGLKYYFVAPKTCGAGSPRVTLLVDSDGDGSTDFAVHGHLNPPIYAGCVMNKWRYEDLGDDLPRWEVTPGGAVPGIPNYPLSPWKTLAAAVTAAFPNHRITAGFLIDGESCGFGVVANCGKAYYDLLTIENRTLEIWQDAVKSGK